MKKTLLIFLFVAVVGAGLSAQELKWSGYVNTGLGFVYTDVDDVDPYFTAFGVDSGQFGYRFRLNGAYTNEEGNAGAKFRFQAQTNGNTPTLPYIYGWFKPIDMLTLNGGLVDDGTWASGGALLNDDVGEGLGILAKLSVSGLDAGVGVYAGATGSGSNNNPIGSMNNNTIKPEDLKYVFSLGYTMENVFKFVASVRTASKTNGGIDIAFTGANRPNDAAIAGFKLLAVPKLTAVLEAKIDHLSKFSDTGTVFIYETLAYDLGALDIGLNAGQYLNQADSSDLGLMAAPWVSYAIGKFVPRLDVLYFLAGKPSYVVDSGTGSSSGKYNFLNWEAYAPTWNDDLSVLAVRPSVRFNFDSNTAIELGDIVNFEMGDKAFNGEDNRLTNIFYVDLVWKF
ncbi:MAG: hypothetical protein LBG26_06700 [Treponema sp.]|nr:hypothetical protein [Treponema sp.]